MPLPSLLAVPLPLPPLLVVPLSLPPLLEMPLTPPSLSEMPLPLPPLLKVPPPTVLTVPIWAETAPTMAQKKRLLVDQTVQVPENVLRATDLLAHPLTVLPQLVSLAPRLVHPQRTRTEPSTSTSPVLLGWTSALLPSTVLSRPPAPSTSCSRPRLRTGSRWTIPGIDDHRN